MSRTILTDVDGFTPLPDLLVKRYNLMTAAVWGKMWRYCQMPNGVCQVTIDRLAGELNVNRMTIIRHIETLVADGFFVDETPDLRNKPHTYRDTGKVSLYNRFGIAITESDSRVTLSDPQSNTELLEDSIKKENKRGTHQEKKGDLLDGMLHFSREHRPELEMRQRFEKALSLSPDWDRHAPRDTWEGFDGWLIARAAEGQQIEVWAEWWKSDPFRVKRTIDLTPNKIKTGWLQAFGVDEPEQVYDEIPELPAVGAPPPDRAEYERVKAKLEAMAHGNYSDNPA